MKVVYINDSTLPDYDSAEQYFLEAANWAQLQCKTFIDFRIQDVSDVSYSYDLIAEYRFKDPRDALLFELKYGN